jgi:CheY-like chemotaxis protein
VTREGPIRVLVVDDDEDFVAFAGALLGAEDDIEVVAEAHDGLEALAFAAELAPDVIVMDLNMPRLDGAEATRLIRRASRRIQVVIVTASDERDVEAARAFGAAARLSKADVARELVATVRRAALQRP